VGRCSTSCQSQQFSVCFVVTVPEIGPSRLSNMDNALTGRQNNRTKQWYDKTMARDKTMGQLCIYIAEQCQLAGVELLMYASPMKSAKAMVAPPSTPLVPDDGCVWVESVRWRLFSWNEVPHRSLRRLICRSRCKSSCSCEVKCPMT
jgi:hypothetical protein